MSFNYHVRIKTGYTYTQEFKDFYAWCVGNLGEHYKDWHLIGGGTQNSYSTLHIRNGKRAMIFTMVWTHIIDYSFDVA